MFKLVQIFVFVCIIKNVMLFESLMGFLKKINTNTFIYSKFNFTAEYNEEIHLNYTKWENYTREENVIFENCTLPSFPTNYFEGFSYVINMTITDCNLKRIDKKYFVPKEYKLITVNFTSNYLQTFQPRIFSSAKSLKILDLSKNLISEIVSETFDGLTNLQILNLNDNKILKINENAFATLNNLTELNLSGNLIKELGTTHFMNQINLKFLYLQTNNIVEFRNVHNDVFKSFQRLRHFDISENPQILHFPLKINLDLFELNELESLNMARTFFQTFNVNTFSKMTALQSLDLSDNNYEKFDIEILNPIKDLKRLYLDGNNLVEIDYENQKINRRNFFLGINNNNWNCSYLYKMETYLNERNINFGLKTNQLRWNISINWIGCENLENYFVEEHANKIETKIDNSTVGVRVHEEEEFQKLNSDYSSSKVFLIIVSICNFIFNSISIAILYIILMKIRGKFQQYNVVYDGVADANLIPLNSN